MTVLTISDGTDLLTLPNLAEALKPLNRPDLAELITKAQTAINDLDNHMTIANRKLAEVTKLIQSATALINQAWGEEEYQSWLVELEVQSWGCSRLPQITYQLPDHVQMD